MTDKKEAAKHKSVVETYAPSNAHKLTDAEKAAMSELTPAQIKELAETYPNKASQNAYLILFDKTKKPNEQLYPVSTWPNLHSLIRAGQKNFAAHSFKSNFSMKAVQAVPKAAEQDLTDQEVKSELRKRQGATDRGVASSLRQPGTEVQQAKEVETVHVGGGLDGGDFEEVRVPDMNDGKKEKPKTRRNSAKAQGSKKGKVKK